MPSEGREDVLVILTMVGQLGLIMVGAVAGGLLAGFYLDRWLGTGPLFTIALTAAGIGGGMLAVYRMVMKAVQPQADSDNEHSAESERE